MSDKALMMSPTMVFTNRRMDFSIRKYLSYGAQSPYFDSVFNGKYRVAGTVGVAGSPDFPVKRLVILYDSFTKRPVRSCRSADDGTYEFNNIRPGPWFVVSYDYTGEFNAVIADNIFGTPM